MNLLDIRNPIPKDLRVFLAPIVEEFENLHSAHRERIDRFRQYREEIESGRSSPYYRDRWDYGRRPDRSSMERHHLALPFGQALTVKHDYRIAGRMPDVTVDRRSESALERHRSATMEKMVWGMIEGSNGRQQLASGGWDASQLGAAPFDLYWRPELQMPIFRNLDPAGILVVPGVDDPHAFQRVYHFWNVSVRSAQAMYRDIAFREEFNFVDHISETHREGTEPMVTLVQYCDPMRRVRFALGGRVPLYEEQHNLGFTPYVVIPNLGPERRIWGWADYEFVRDLCKYIPEQFSREADVVRMAAGGGFIDKGTGQTPETILDIIQKGGVLPSKSDGSVEPIPSAKLPDFLPGHNGQALAFLQMLGFAPGAAWGQGGAGSGTDRGLQLMPLTELTTMKQINWASGLARLFGYAFRMIEQMQEREAIYRGTVLHSSSRRRDRFAMTIGPDLFDEMENPDVEDPELLLRLPRSPRELFDGDYSVGFTWQNRIDPEEPAFVMSELNKFAQGVQSAVTTMERLGFKNPEDELRKIEEEAERMPWLRNGTIALLRAELQAQGVSQRGFGGGAPFDPASSLLSGLEGMDTKDGSAVYGDAGAGSLPGGIGEPFGGA